MIAYGYARDEQSVFKIAKAVAAATTLRAKLKEYNLPVESRATVQADIVYPDLTNGVLALAEIQPGVFEGAMVGNVPGIYRFTTRASGVTYRGTPFTREQILNAAVFRGIPDTPGRPIGGVAKTDICQLLACLLDTKNLSREFEDSLKKQGISLAGIRKCVESFCKGRP